MKRRLFNLAAALSLLLCMATVVLWVRSYWWEDQLTYWNGWHCDIVGSSYGGIHCCRIPGRVSGYGEGLEYHRTTPLRMESRMGVQPRSWPGFQIFSVVPYMMSTPLRSYVVSDWLLITLFALAPALWLRRTLQPDHRGHCRNCGYDLRASPERCPECGAVASTAVTK